MPNVTRINSGKGLVAFTRKDLADLDLTRWIRSDSNGVGNRNFIDVIPIEREAAHAFTKKYPSTQVKIAEKTFLNEDGGVEVILRVAEDNAKGAFKHHPTKLTFMGDVKAKDNDATFNEKMEKKEKTSGLLFPIDFLEENLHKLSEAEKRQIYAELGEDHAQAFLEDLRLTMADVDIKKIAKELSTDDDTTDDSAEEPED